METTDAEPGAREGGTGDVETLTICAALVLGLGPGAACAFYLQLVGFYTQGFQSNAFYIMMIVVLFAPYPLVGILQSYYDEKFDLSFSTRAAYIFRTVFVQSLTAGLVGLWIGLPQTPVSVLAIGLCLGILTAVASTSGLQMVAAIDPKVLCIAQFGRELGGLLPTLVFGVHGFTPNSPMSAFKSSVACLFAPIGFSILFLGGLNCTDIFTRSYDVLASVKLRARSPNVKWVLPWSMSLCVQKTLTFCLISCMPFLVNPIAQQHLSMTQFASFLFGRLLVLPLQMNTSFPSEPWNRLLVGILILRAVIFAVLLRCMIKSERPDQHPLFVVVWAFFMVLDSFNLSFVDVTTNMLVEMPGRKTVVRWNSISTFAGILLGVAATAAIVVPSSALGLELPPSNSAIPPAGTRAPYSPY